MITGNASRDAKFSVLSLLLIGVIVTFGLLVGIDRLIAPGLHTIGKMGFCQAVGAKCQAALLSLSYIFSDPKILFVILGLFSLTFALFKGLLIILSPLVYASSFVEVSRSLPKKLERVLRNLDFPKKPTIKISPDREPLAFTEGIFNPSICLSKGIIDKLKDEELKAVVSHEYAHIRRRDNLYIFIMLLIRDMLFLLPLSHFFFKLFVREKEHAADDIAIDMTRNPLGLAEAILSLYRLSGRLRDPSPVYATFFPSKATAKSRVERLLGKGVIQPKREAKRLLVSLILSVFIMGILAGIAFAMPVSKEAVNTCQTPQVHITQSVCCSR